MLEPKPCAGGCESKCKRSTRLVPELVVLKLQGLGLLSLALQGEV